MVSLSSFISLLFWQFSQFILVCELVILIVMYATGFIKKAVIYKIVMCLSVSNLSCLLYIVKFCEMLV